MEGSSLHLILCAGPDRHWHAINNLFDVHHLKNCKGVPDGYPNIACACKLTSCHVQAETPARTYATAFAILLHLGCPAIIVQPARPCLVLSSLSSTTPFINMYMAERQCVRFHHPMTPIISERGARARGTDIQVLLSQSSRMIRSKCLSLLVHAAAQRQDS